MNPYVALYFQETQASFLSREFEIEVSVNFKKLQEGKRICQFLVYTVNLAYFSIPSDAEKELGACSFILREGL